MINECNCRLLAGSVQLKDNVSDDCTSENQWFLYCEDISHFSHHVS